VLDKRLASGEALGELPGAERTSLVSEVGSLLRSGGDYRQTLQNVADAVVPLLADWCAIDAVAEGPSPVRVAAAHRDPAKAAVVRELPALRPPSLMRPGATWEPLIEEIAPRTEHREVLKTLGFGSHVVLPLAAGGRTVGTMTFAASESGRYGEQELWVAREVSDRVAPFVDGALTRELLDRERSERASLEQKLLAAETQYGTLIEQIPAVIYTQEVDESDNPKAVTYISRRVEDMLGYSPEEEMADPEHWIHKLHPDDREWVIAEDERTDRTGDPFSVEYRQIAKDGSVVWIRDEAVLVRDPDGRPLYWQGVQYDVTESKEASAELERQARELERSNEELEQFAYIASHDLQEPLRMVSSYTQLLARRYGDKLDEDAREFIGYAVDGAERMHTLINDLLRFSRVETRGREFVPTDLGWVLEAALANLRVAVEESGAQVTWDAMPTVRGDEVQLVQLFQNLVGNAIKFRREEPPRVHVGVRKEGAWWEISVRDNGIGIDEPYVDRIFVIFRRLHGKSEYQGTGIGLAICKKIVERHGGRIWVESRPGVGSTFLFTLPAAEGVET
jgi:PAS domain S-box-containing protein